MKKIVFFLILLYAGATFAQPQQIDSTEGDFYNDMDYLLRNLDFSEVNSGLLLDKTFPLIVLDHFDGAYTSDNWTDINRFGSIYGTLAGAAVDPAVSLEDPAKAYMDAWRARERDPNISMNILLYDYHKFKEDAINLNLIEEINGQLFDVGGRTESPYQTQTVFALAPLEKSTDQLTVTFDFPVSSFFSNRGAEVLLYEIDLGDGTGDRRFNLGDQITTTYPSEGKKDLILTCRMTDGSILKSHTSLEVNDASFRYGAIPLDVNIPATSAHAGATMNIFLHCPEEGLRKPMIFIEGFDPPQLANIDFNYMLGILGYAPVSGPNATALAALDAEGYDLIFVDYNYGSDFIQRNARAVQDVVRMVNAMKDSIGSTEPNVIVGASMGSLTGKYALLEMENQQEDHDTRLFVNFDGPTIGANVPFGAQQLVKHMLEMNIGIFWDISDFVPEVEEFAELVDEPAVRQMLIYSAFHGGSNMTDPMYTAFYQDLQSLGTPSTFEYIAISNGSIRGVGQLFGPHTKLVDINGSVDDLLTSQAGSTDFWASVIEIAAIVILKTGAKVDIDVWALPDQVSNFEKVYHGKIRLFVLGIPIIFTTRNVYVANTLALDSAPGGMFGFSTAFIGNLNLQDIMSVPFRSVCFIPTVSALNIESPQNQMLTADYTDIAVVTANWTDLDNYIGSTNTSDFSYGFLQDNQRHVELTDENYPFLFSYVGSEDGLSSISSINNRTYNFGESDVPFDPTMPNALRRTPSILQKNLWVQNTGKLWVNRNDDIAFTDENNPANTEPSHFDLYLQGRCGNSSALRIQNGGEFYIGDKIVNNNPGIYNTGTVYVRDGARVYIKNGGVTKLDKDSKLVIQEDGYVKVESGGSLQTTNPSSIIVESGGVLEIDAGANIQLWWNSSTIHVKEGGQLIYNGAFNFSGKGYFQFDPGHIFTLNADFTLHGQGNSYRFIRLNGNAVLDFGSRDLTLKYGLVEYSAGEIRMGPGSAGDFYAINFVASPGSDATALIIDNPDKLEMFGCDFINPFVGIHLSNFNPSDAIALHLLDFENCTFGMLLDNGDEISIHNSNFYAGNLSGIGIQANDVQSMGLYGNSFYDCKLESFGNLDLNRVGEVYVSGNLFRDNRVGVKLVDVRDFKMVNGLIEQTDPYELTPSPRIGIYAPGDDGHNYTNITLSNNARIKACDIGIQVEKGGYLVPLDFEFGKVKMDCAKLLHNDIGIGGVDVKLEIDAFDHCNCTDPTQAKPNTFIKSAIQTNLQRHFNICYDDLSITDISARSNYWQGGFHNILEECSSGADVTLNTADAVATEPTNCNTSSPPETDKTPREESTEETERNYWLRTSPNPSENGFEVLSPAGTYQLTIYNTLGQNIWEDAQFSGNTFVESTDWPRGLYLIQVIDRNSNLKYLTKQLIK